MSLHPDSIPVVLSASDVSIAWLAALERRGNSRDMGLSERHGAHGADGRGLQRDMTGALCEIALARWAGLSSTWRPTADSFKSPDLILPNGLPIQVRGRSRHDWDRILRQDDGDGQVWYHVTISSGGSPMALVHGWMVSSEGRRPEWLRAYGDRPEAWFVPSTAHRSPLVVPTPASVQGLLGHGRIQV